MRPFSALIVFSGLLFAADGADDKELAKNLEAYMEIRAKAEAEIPKARSSEDPAVLEAHQTSLYQAIRNRRQSAKQGDIFTAPVRERIKASLRSETSGVAGASAKETVKTGNPVNEGAAFVPKVNESYPVGAPLSSVPPAMLARLPKLPKDLEYRFVGKTLILLDAGPRLIVDLIPNALP